MPSFLLRYNRHRWEKSQLILWQQKGCPAPPPHIVKQEAIKEYQQKYKYATLVETGTFRGDMIEAQKGRFQKIYSIELDAEWFEKAQKRFRRNKDVTILQGDSGKVLPIIIQQLNEPAIFWLDGHYSGDNTALGDKQCPIYEELEAVFKGKKLDHVILIDDARCFTGEYDYPTIEELTGFIKERDDSYRVEVKHDIIHCVNTNSN